MKLFVCMLVLAVASPSLTWPKVQRWTILFRKSKKPVGQAKNQKEIDYVTAYCKAKVASFFLEQFELEKSRIK
jgi:hypothetical protein